MSYGNIFHFNGDDASDIIPITVPEWNALVSGGGSIVTPMTPGNILVGLSSTTAGTDNEWIGSTINVEKDLTFGPDGSITPFMTIASSTNKAYIQTQVGNDNADAFNVYDSSSTSILNVNTLVPRITTNGSMTIQGPSDSYKLLISYPDTTVFTYFDTLDGIVYMKSTLVVDNVTFGPSQFTGSLVMQGAEITSLTASTALVSDGSKNITSSSVTSTELSYVSGTTSNIQSQINAITSAGLSGTLTTNVVPYASGAHTLADNTAGTTNTELGYSHGVTSAIQTQFNNLTNTAGLTSGDFIKATGSNSMGNSSILSESGTTLTSIGDLWIQGANNHNKFRILNNSSVDLFQVDTLSSQTLINTTTINCPLLTASALAQIDSSNNLFSSNTLNGITLTMTDGSGNTFFFVDPVTSDFTIGGASTITTRFKNSSNITLFKVDPSLNIVNIGGTGTNTGFNCYDTSANTIFNVNPSTPSVTIGGTGTNTGFNCYDTSANAILSVDPSTPSVTIGGTTNTSFICANSTGGQHINVNPANKQIGIAGFGSNAGTTLASGSVNISSTGTSGNMVISSSYTGTSNGAVCFIVSSVANSTANHAVNFICSGGTAYVSGAGTFVGISDKNLKTHIGESLGLDFINDIQPVSYKFKNGTETMHGIYAQDIYQMCKNKGYDFNGATVGNEEMNWGFDYTQLIAPLVKAVQQLTDMNVELSQRVIKLEQKVGLI